MHVSSDVPQFAARLILGAALLCGGVQAQTLVDTATSVSVQSTLLQSQSGTPVPRLPAIPSAPAPSSAPAAANAPTSPAQGAQAPAPAASAVPAVVATPLTEEQRRTLGAAQASLAAEQFVQARAQFEGLILQNFTSPEPHFGLGLTLYALGDLRGAQFEFEQFVRLAPTRPEGPYNIGVIATRQGRYAEALTAYQSALTLADGAKLDATSPQRRQILRALAGEQSRARDYAGLAQTYAALRTAEPNNLEYTYRTAQALFLAGQAADALPLTYAVLRDKPTSLDAALLLADIYVSQNLPDRALREVEAAIKRSETGGARSALLLRRADLLAAPGTPVALRAAAQAARDAGREDSRNVQAFVREGALLAQLGNREGALTAYQAANRLAPRNPVYLTELAALYLAGNDYPQAAQAARQAQRLSPDVPTQARAQYIQGVVAYRQGDFAQARAALLSSTGTLPAAESWLWLGLSQYALKDYQAAATSLAESVRLRPSATARQNLGAALLASGRYGEAEATLRGLVGEDAKNAEGWYLLGLAQRSQSQEEQARASLKVAANLGDARAKEALK